MIFYIKIKCYTMGDEISANTYMDRIPAPSDSLKGLYLRGSLSDV